MDRIRAKRFEDREKLRERVSQELRQILQEVLPGEPVIVFGSLLKPGAFNRHSDVDIALFAEPKAKSIYWLHGELMERLRRPVDVVILSESRLKDKIKATGERWMS